MRAPIFKFLFAEDDAVAGHGFMSDRDRHAMGVETLTSPVSNRHWNCGVSIGDDHSSTAVSQQQVMSSGNDFIRKFDHKWSITIKLELTERHAGLLSRQVRQI